MTAKRCRSRARRGGSRSSDRWRMRRGGGGGPGGGPPGGGGRAAAGEMRGPWWGAAGVDGQVSVVAGMHAVLPESQVLHAPGVPIDGEDVSGVAAALDLCARADAILLCLGEAAAMSGEAASRVHLDLPGRQ